MLSWVKYHEYYAVVPHGEGTMIRPVPFQLVSTIRDWPEAHLSGRRAGETSSERDTT